MACCRAMEATTVAQSTQWRHGGINPGYGFKWSVRLFVGVQAKALLSFIPVRTTATPLGAVSLLWRCRCGLSPPPTIGSSGWKPWSFLWSGNGGVIDVVSSMEALPWSSLHNTSWDWCEVQWRWLALGDGEDLASVLRFTRVANRHKR